MADAKFASRISLGTLVLAAQLAERTFLHMNHESFDPVLSGLRLPFCSTLLQRRADERSSHSTEDDSGSAWSRDYRGIHIGCLWLKTGTGKESRSRGQVGAEIERAVTTQEQQSKVAGIDYSGSLTAINENGSGVAIS
jgi:hypothetical protein